MLMKDSVQESEETNSSTFCQGFKVKPVQQSRAETLVVWSNFLVIQRTARL